MNASGISRRRSCDPTGFPYLSHSPWRRWLDPEGLILGRVVVARDVTEQHLAQATLAEIDARLEEAEALSHVGSWLWDLRTGTVQWSMEFHRIHGIDPLDFAGTFESYMDQINVTDSDRVRDAMTTSVGSSRPVDLDYRVVHPDQKTHVVWVHANPTLGSDGKAVGLRGIGQDVTDQAGSRETWPQRSPQLSEVRRPFATIEAGRQAVEERLSRRWTAAPRRRGVRGHPGRCAASAWSARAARSPVCRRPVRR